MVANEGHISELQTERDPHVRRDRRAENNGDVIVFGTKGPREDEVPWVENAILCHMQLEMEGGLTIKITETWPANPGHGGQAGCLPRHRPKALVAGPESKTRLPQALLDGRADCERQDSRKVTMEGGMEPWERCQPDRPLQ